MQQRIPVVGAVHDETLVGRRGLATTRCATCAPRRLSQKVQNVAATVAPMDREALYERYRIERDKRLRPDGATQYLEPIGRFAEGQDPTLADVRNARGYPAGPAPFFAYIEAWRRAGTFHGLEFRGGRRDALDR